jgi:alpha-L-rhamnosidase
MALYLGLSPHPKLTAKCLHDRIIADDWRLTTGNLCSKYIFDVLSENGYLEDAWRLMNRTEYPSIGYMISQEATTVWERFELMKSSAMNSHNHPMYAAVGYWMFAYLVGIKPIEAGWKTCSINPYIPNGLNSAQAAVETPLGMISVRWTKRYGAVNLQVQIPFGMKAHIKFFGIDDTIDSGFYSYASKMQ